MPEDLLGAPRPQHVSVIDRVAAGHHRVHQGQHLAAGPVVAGSVAEVDQLVDHGLHPQPFGQGSGQCQAGVGDRVVVIERDHEGAGVCDDGVEKVPSELGFVAGSQPPFSQLKGPFHNHITAHTTRRSGGSRLRA
jgi:hypothetical protein